MITPAGPARRWSLAIPPAEPTMRRSGHDSPTSRAWNRAPRERLEFVVPLQGTILLIAHLGRRSAAGAASLCPRLICCAPSGRKTPRRGQETRRIQLIPRCSAPSGRKTPRWQGRMTPRWQVELLPLGYGTVNVNRGLGRSGRRSRPSRRKSGTCPDIVAPSRRCRPDSIVAHSPRWQPRWECAPRAMRCAGTMSRYR